MTKFTRKSEFHQPCTPAQSFQHELCREIDCNNMGVMPNVNFFTLQLEQGSTERLVWLFLNQKVITAINILDSSTLGDNLITSLQADYMSSVLIPAKAVENNQEYHVISLVTPCA